MRGHEASVDIIWTAEEQGLLEHLRSVTTSLGLAQRCRAILGAVDGPALVKVARLVDATEKHVRKWVRRQQKDGLEEVI
jgi:hypothetical protein